EAVARYLSRIDEVDVEAVTAARRQLGRGESDPKPRCTPVADVIEEPAPPTPEVEHAPSGLDPDLLSDVLVLAPLGLLEGQGEIPVVLGPAEVGKLAQTESDDSVGQRIAEIDVFALGHRCSRGPS